MFYQAGLVRASDDAKKQWFGVAANLIEGAPVFLIGDASSWDVSCSHARKAGLVPEDTLLAIFPKQVIPCILLRKEKGLPTVPCEPLLFHDENCTLLECEAGCQGLMHRGKIEVLSHMYSTDQHLYDHLESLLLPSANDRLLTWYPNAPH